MLRAALSIAALIAVAFQPALATAQGLERISPAAGICGELQSSFGPYDYRTIDARRKQLVEKAHFTPKVETLRAGATGSLGADIDYTLRTMPNHHRALMAMARLGELTRSTQPRGATYPVECYFDRAIRFAVDDAMVRVLYGVFLAKANRSDEAQTQLTLAEKLGLADPQVVYNLGLGYLELGNYDRAVEFAKKAESMGVAFDGLRSRLERMGKWPG